MTDRLDTSSKVDKILDNIAVNPRISSDPRDAALFSQAAKKLEQLLQEERREAAIEELKRLWNVTQPDLVPEGTPPQDMSEELHRRIESLTKEDNKENL